MKSRNIGDNCTDFLCVSVEIRLKSSLFSAVRSFSSEILYMYVLMRDALIAWLSLLLLRWQIFCDSSFGWVSRKFVWYVAAHIRSSPGIHSFVAHVLDVYEIREFAGTGPIS